MQRHACSNVCCAGNVAGILNLYLDMCRMFLGCIPSAFTLAVHSSSLMYVRVCALPVRCPSHPLPFALHAVPLHPHTLSTLTLTPSPPHTLPLSPHSPPSHSLPLHSTLPLHPHTPSPPLSTPSPPSHSLSTPSHSPSPTSLQVMFKVGVCGRTGAKRAVNVVVKRETMKGTVDTLKDQVRCLI